MDKYRTRQRDEILRFFMDHEEQCFTAREICEKVSAGEATVFRTLSSLSESGKIKRFSGSRNEGAYYQYNHCDSDEHIHLVCDRCGQLIHMDCSFMTDILTHFRNEHGFTVNCSKTIIYGLCSKCSGEVSEK